MRIIKQPVALLMAMVLVSSNMASVQAQESLTICFHYGCRQTALVRVAESQRLQLAKLFVKIADAAAERQALALAVQKLYLNAGEQSPIWQDKGGNFNDGAAKGRMDCVDHSTNTTTFLNYLARQGWLKYHRITPPVYRLPRLICIMLRNCKSCKVAKNG